MRIRGLQNTDSYKGYMSAINNPTPLDSVGRQGISFQGMGPQGAAMQNQLALLLGRKP